MITTMIVRVRCDGKGCKKTAKVHISSTVGSIRLQAPNATGWTRKRGKDYCWACSAKRRKVR